MTPEFKYVWFWRKRLPERKGMRCRILVKGTKSIMIQFEDGNRVITSLNAIRKAPLQRCNGA
jgi:hypothetical protein